MEFKSKPVHPYFEQNADRFTDAGEGSAKRGLLTFESDPAGSVVAQDLIAVLCN
jgi:hypothetical protein